MTQPELARVVIEQIPVRLWQQSQEHSDELLREFMLIAAEQRRSQRSHGVPQMLTELIEELTGEYGGFGEANDQLLTDAAAAGVDAVDLVYQLPAAVSDGARRLGELLDAADDYCRAGEHLLTLATPPSQVAFRRWFLDEFVRQIAGDQPTPWPDYVRKIEA
jgi:hypothetical protein